MSHEPKQVLSKLIKTITVGKVSVGKSSIILKYAERNANQTHTTVGIDILMKKITHKGQAYSLELWDTAGHERYRTVVYNYFSYAQAAIVVFDLSDEQSLDQAKTWLEQINLHCEEKVPKVLIGNKSDLFTKDELAKLLLSYKQRIDNLKNEFHCDFFPVSAATGENLQTCFTSLLERAIQQVSSLNLAKTIKLGSSVRMEQLCGKRSDRCC